MRPDEVSREWPQRRQDAAAVLWSSFLAAALASLICFAVIDPVALDLWTWDNGPTGARMSGYAIGFFFFWSIAAVSSLITVYLIRTARRRP